jgi:hypothetical protein
LTQVLEDNNVHTLISTLTFKIQGGVPSEVHLVLAADASKTTKRYVINGWGVPIRDNERSAKHINLPIGLLALKTFIDARI